MLSSDCSVSEFCKNKDVRCYACMDQDQYKEKKYLNRNQIRKTPSKKKKGMAFEEETAKRYNKYMAKRQPLSGGIWGFEGDIETVLTLMECKYRDNPLKGGDKSISIKRSWLEKIKDEAIEHSKIPALPFGFSEDPDEIYFAMEYDYLLELLYRIKSLREQNYILENKLEEN